jgi:hypothetical protein
MHSRPHSSTNSPGFDPRLSAAGHNTPVLELPFSDPHKVIVRTDKTIKIVVPASRSLYLQTFKPAYLLEGAHHDTGSAAPLEVKTQRTNVAVLSERI